MILYPTKDEYEWVGKEKYRQIALKGTGTLETKWKRKDGEIIDVLMSSTPIDETDLLKGVTFTVLDITESKRLQNALKESQERFVLVNEATSDGIYDWDLITNKLYYSTGWKKMLGYEEHELKNEISVWEKLTKPEDVEKTLEVLTNHLEGRSDKYEVEFKMRHKKGHWVDILSRGNAIFNEEGKAVRLVGTHVDITERKRDEIVKGAYIRLIDYALNHSSNELLIRFLDEAEELTGSSIGFYHFLEDDQETITLQAWSTNTLENMCTAEGKGLHYPVSQAGVWVDCITRQEPVIHNDYASLAHKKGMPEGHAMVTREMVVPVFRGGKIVAILGVGNKESDYAQQDVEIVQKLADLAWETVVRKQAEEFVLKERDRSANILQATNAGTWDWNVQTGEVWNDESWCNIIGYSLKELQPLETDFWQRNMHPDDAESTMSALNRHLAGKLEYYEAEFRQKHKEGGWVWIMSRGKVIEWTNDGKPLRMYGTHLNIDKRKLVEQELKNRNAFIQTVLDRLPIGVALNKFDEGNATYMNKKFEEIYGWPFDELKSVPAFFEKVYPDEKYRDEIIKRIMEDINSGIIERMHWEDIEVTHKSGEKRIVNAVNIPLFEQNTMVSTVIDVTRQKEYEKELEKHRNNLELLVKERTDELEASNEELEVTNEELHAQKTSLKKPFRSLTAHRQNLYSPRKWLH
ncbi:MAG: PAS domain-containing protein [Chloroflexia bacterium]|nr:PAS domain-containing protein [Chloroflexia bacterium]